MKKLILLSLCFGLLAAAPAKAQDYDNQYKRPVPANGYYHHNTSLSQSLAQKRWEEMRQVERDSLVRAQIPGWDSLSVSDHAAAARQAEYNWKKMSMTERRDIIMAWQRNHPHDMGPLNDTLEDMTENR